MSVQDEDELFNADYVEVDRVLDVSTTSDPVTQEQVTHCLVKWRSLPYEDSTWELEQDVDKRKILQHKNYSELPPEEEREVIANKLRCSLLHGTNAESFTCKLSGLWTVSGATLGQILGETGGNSSVQRWEHTAGIPVGRTQLADLLLSQQVGRQARHSSGGRKDPRNSWS